MDKFLPYLKIGSMVVGALGYLLTAELQRRETEAIVEKALAKREEQASKTAPN